MPYFPKDLADRAEQFIHALSQTHYGRVGLANRLACAPFQRDYVRKLVGMVRDSDRETRQSQMSYLALACKNGKSTLSSADCPVLTLFRPRDRFAGGQRHLQPRKVEIVEIPETKKRGRQALPGAG
jgi:hypothetical protein